MKKVKVFLVSKDYRGGIETLMGQLSKIDGSVFEVRRAFYQKDDFGTYLKSDFFFRKFRRDKFPFTLSRLKYFVQNVISTYKLIKNGKFDLVITFPNYSFIVVSFVKLFYKNFKAISNINNNIEAIIGQKVSVFDRLLLNLAIKFAAQQYDLHIVVSQDLVNILINKYGFPKDKIVLIYNVVEVDKIKKLSRTKLSKKDSSLLVGKKNVKIFSVARFDSQKDNLTLLKAFKLVLKDDDTCELFLVGDGQLRKKLERFCVKNGIMRNVHFFGWKVNIFKYLRYGDIFVLSSNYEGMPFSILEAMALGLPVISTDSPTGPREVLGNGEYGILTPVGDEVRLAKSILRLARSRALRSIYSKKALKRVLKFDATDVIHRYERLFTQMVK